MGQPLEGVRVLELATGVSGPYAGKLLADFGAEVVKLEPPGGDPSRCEVVQPGEAPDPERSPLFLHLNTNKRSAVADLARPEGRALAAELAAWADLVIESHRPGALHELGLGFEALERRRPGRVLLSVTPFGQTGPYARFKGAELLLYALGGPMTATGLAERAPVKLAGNVVGVQCGNVAALAGLAALETARRSGRGVHVDVANIETQAGSADRRTLYLAYCAFTGQNVPREGGHRVSVSPTGVFPTADGYVQIVITVQWLERMAGLLGDAELAARLAAHGTARDPELAEAVDSALHGWTLARTSAEAMAEAQAAGLAVMAVNSPLGVLADPHLRGRGFFVDAGGYELPGPPVRMADGWRLRAPAPRLGEHQAEVEALTAPPAPAPARDPARPAPDPARLPLEGVRVIDLGVVLAGPHCTMLLGDLGAEVIRVENPNLFPTATRGAVPRPDAGQVRRLGVFWGSYPDFDPGDRPWNRVGPYTTNARNKLGATVDLRRPFGREMFLRLVERCDVLVENNSVRVLAALDLDWPVLHAANPRLILVRMPSLGLSGPYTDYIGFGANVEALCGLTALRGYPDVDLSETDATYTMDPASAAAAGFAVLAALRRRERTGLGELVEVAQGENLVNHIGEYVVDASLTGRVRTTLGNRHPTRAPQGVYRCRGEDRWAAISVGDDAEWAALVDLLGRPAWAQHESLAAAAGRWAAHDELDLRIAAWTAELDQREVFERCQAAGVPAAPVLDEAGCFEDPHLAARGFFRLNESADVPPTRFPGHLWRGNGPPLRWGPLCRLGGDNEAVWRGVAGVSDEEWERLGAGGHLSLDYLDDAGRPL